MKLFDNLFDRQDKSILKLLPITEYDDNLDCFITAEKKCIDILSFVTKDLAAASEDAVEYDIMLLARFFKTYEDDVKIFGLNYPTNTKVQQQYIRHKLASTRYEVYKPFLQTKLAELEYIEKNRTEREYYLMFFSDDPIKHRDNINKIIKSLGSSGLIMQMDKKKKIQVLFKINNKNTSIFI